MTLHKIFMIHFREKIREYKLYIFLSIILVFVATIYEERLIKINGLQ